MGINGLLPRILPSAGREKYDLRSLRDGVIVANSNSTNGKRKHSQQQQTKSQSWKRRKIRLAVDLHGWISRACHGNGAYLMDERHLSYHGRALLKRERDGVENGIEHHNDNEAATFEQQQLEYIYKVIQFIMRRISYLTDECNIQILLVLDGSTPPIKRNVVSDRRGKRRTAVEERDANVSPQKQTHADEDEAIATEKETLSRISASKRAGSGIDPGLKSMLHFHLLNELKANNLPFLISPYEADGQLAHLSTIGQVDGVITEDSDLICYGIPQLIYKLGGWNGDNDANRSSSNLYGTLLRRQDLGSAHGIDLLDFSDSMLVVMFVSSGCDYCDSLRGIGIVTARDIVKRVFFTKSDVPVLKRVMCELYQKCHRSVREKLLPLEDEEKEVARSAYEKAFLGAVAMYRHPLVYDPILGDVLANDVSSMENDGHGSSSKAQLPSQFLREELVLMKYEPYRKLVTNKAEMYELVGTPCPPDLAKKVARGLQDRPDFNNRECSENAPTAGSPSKAAESLNNSIETQDAEALNCNQHATQGTTSTHGSSNLQSSSQDFTFQDSIRTQPSTQGSSVIGSRGTQQSKSSSDKTLTLSSLSPDLLASPSPAKRKSLSL